MGDKARVPSAVVGARIKSLRSAKPLSQRQLAERVSGCGPRWSHTTVMNIEAGKRPVSTDELVCLGLVLGVSPLELLSPDSDVAVGDVQIDRNLYNAWLEGHGKLWLGDDGKLTFDNDLAFEFFKRQGLLVEGDK